MTIRPGLALLNHQRRLTSRFAARLGRGEAEDLASEAIARGLARPAPDGRQEPWIETIFRNLVADTHRRLERRAATIVDEPVDEGASPEDLVLGHERRHALASVLPAIPDELREALVARFYGDQEYEQMAALRGISVTTARTRVWRALARLRRSLEGMRAWMPATFGNAWLSAAAVAVLAIGPGMNGRAPHATMGEVIQDAGSRRAPAMRASIGPPTLRFAAETRTRETTRRPPTTHAASTKDEPTETDAKPEAVKRFDFENDEVTGDLAQPGLIFVTGGPREEKLGSLIEIPRSLWPSMAKMLEDN